MPRFGVPPQPTTGPPTTTAPASARPSLASNGDVIPSIVAGTQEAAPYQISHRLPPPGTIGTPSLHWNAWANSGRFESGPLTRYFGGECGLVATSRRSDSGR